MNTRTNKLLTLTLLFVFSIAATPSFAQTKDVRLPARELTVAESIELLRSQTGMMFSYKSRELQPARTVKFESLNTDIDRVLAQIVAGTEMRYEQQGGYIIFYRPTEQQPTKPVRPVVSNTSALGDVYTPSDLTALDGRSRRRPLPPPVIRIAEETVVVADTMRSANEENFSSRIVPPASYLPAKQPMWSLKTNILYAAGTFTPNLAVEVGLGRRTTLEVAGSYNGWGLNGSLEDNKKWAHWYIRPEFRYWLCERFNGHFFGVNASYVKYNVGTVEVPLLFKKENRYEGDGFTVGLTYGYQLMLAKRWGLEFNVGVGYARLKYDRYPCASCNYDPVKDETKNYFGPTRAGVTLTFIIK